MKLFQSNQDVGGVSRWIGDGFCDDMNNNEDCTIVLDNVGGGADQFDGGDCCGTDAMHNYCIECICFGKLKFSITWARVDQICYGMIKFNIAWTKTFTENWTSIQSFFVLILKTA